LKSFDIVVIIYLFQEPVSPKCHKLGLFVFPKVYLGLIVKTCFMLHVQIYENENSI